MPVHHFQSLGNSFINFLLDLVEDPPQQDGRQEIPDSFVGLILSYNLQFASRDVSSNVVMCCLEHRAHAKSFIERILLLLNREDDPAAIVRLEEAVMSLSSYELSVAPSIPNSLHKMTLDAFHHKACSQQFSSNDIYVLIDIIVRQLEDLSPEDYRRAIYVKMCSLVLMRRGDYDHHLHRFQDLQRCFIKILEEAQDTKDKEIILDICKEIEAFASLLP